MSESSQNNRFSSSDSEGETTSWQPPLGLQNPLVTPHPLGQNFLSPKFLSPLGAQPLGGGNPLGASAQALSDYNLSENFFQNSSPLAESQLSLNSPEAAVTAAATPTVGMDSTPVNIQRYPGETSTANGHENNPISAASDNLSEAERRLLGQDQAEVTTQELQLAAPHEQLGASDTTALNPTVVQPKLATEPLLQREIAIPEAPKAVEPIRESSVSESESSVQIPEVTEEPSAIANANPSVMRSADLSNVLPPQTSPVAPLPSLPADHLSSIEPSVSSQAELSPVHGIEPAQDTEQNTQDVPSVSVQRQEDEASPPSLVEPLPLPSQALPDASQPPQSFVQTQATADSPPALNPPTAESLSAIAPVLASDHVNVQPLVQPNSDSEAVAIAETSDLPLSIAGSSPTAGENLQEPGITPSEPTVVQAFSETESSALSQSAAAPLESPILTEPERHQSSIIGEPVADSSTPVATSELETITPSSSPTLEEPQQTTEAPGLDTDTAPSHSQILQPRLEREPFAAAEITSPTTPEASSIQRQPLPQTEEMAPSAIAPTQQEALAAAEITSPTTPEASSIQRQPLPQTEEMAPSVIAPTPEEAIAHPDIISPTTPEESAIQRQPLAETQETALGAIAPTPEEASTPPDITSPTAPQESAIQTQLLPETQETAPSAIAPTPEEALAHPDITSSTAPEASSIQTQLLPQIDEMAPGAIAPTQKEVSTHPDITSPTAPQESAIQTQLLPETQETAPSAIAPPQKEALAHPDITSPTAAQESAIQRQPLPQTALVDTASTPSASETKLPSTISQTITTDSTLVMPKALPDEATPVPYPTQPESLQPTAISQPNENTSLTEPIIAQPLLESDTNLQSETLPTLKNSEEVQENSPQVSPTSLNSSPLPAHLLQTKANLTEDESFHQNPDVPQLPTVLENLVGTYHTLPLIQPLNQQSSLLSSTSTSEFSREQPTIVQSMPETLNRLVVPSTAPSALPEDAFNQGLQSTVKVPPVSLDTEPLTLQRATDAIPKTTPESNQEAQRIGNSTYTSEIPNSWSSIADLLENTTTNSSSAFGGETPIQMAFNDSINQAPSDLQESNAWENLIPEYSRSSDASSSFSQEIPIQRFTTEEASIQDDSSATENPAQDKEAQDKDEQNLERLAWEIYSLVRQRLAIERERYGSYY
ncbi:hypothetical protein [Allocoleopsis sp.]|uniref:hypothetical protein n=1 Tax=Allocoleopsis sp. TaxID=3088169 RepID=UPI002FD2427C